MDLDVLELAWAAGFYDGEGCTFTSVDGGRVTMQVLITQVDRRVLDRFQAAVGGLGKVYGPRRRVAANQRDYFVFAAYRFEHSQAVIAMLWRFLSEQKREQALYAIGRFHAHTTARRQVHLTSAAVCTKGHPRSRFAKQGDRVRCLECGRENWYQRQGREVPVHSGVGRPVQRPA